MPRPCNIRHVLTFVVCCLAFAIAAAQSQDSVSAVGRQSYLDSAEGLQQQFTDLDRAARSSDKAVFQVGLDSLGIPNADKWFATHFEPRFLAQLSQEYAPALSKYESHITWVMENFAKFDDFAVKVQPSEMPAPLGESGFESLLPRPVDAVKIENYRLSGASSDPKHAPPSWVSSFTYVDGRFRFVGGTYPFWAEKLTGWRGPMSLPPKVIHGMTVQGTAFQKDLEGPSIAAVVQLKVDIGRDGRANHIKVLSGDQHFVQDAKDYVKATDFGPLPDIPQLANAKREWEIAVAFFKPKN
jgi:hypothetical protein